MGPTAEERAQQPTANSPNTAPSVRRAALASFPMRCRSRVFTGARPRPPARPTAPRTFIRSILNQWMRDMFCAGMFWPRINDISAAATTRLPWLLVCACRAARSRPAGRAVRPCAPRPTPWRPGQTPNHHPSAARPRWDAWCWAQLSRELTEQQHRGMCPISVQAPMTLVNNNTALDHSN